MLSGRGRDFAGALQKVVARQLQDRVEAPLEANGGARPAAHAFAARTLEMRWEDFDIVLQLQQPLYARVLRECTLVTTEIRPAHVADEQRVTTQHHRRDRTANRVGHHERDRLRPMARRVDHVYADLSKVHILGVVQRMERKIDLRVHVQHQLGAGRRGQRAVTGDVVGVQVRVDDVDDAILALFGQVQVRLDVALRIDDRGLS